MPPKDLFRAVLALSFVVVQAAPLRAEDPDPKKAAKDYWLELRTRSGGERGGQLTLPADQVFAPDSPALKDPAMRAELTRLASISLGRSAQEREFDHPYWSTMKAYLDPVNQSRDLGQMMSENGQLRTVLWESMRPGGDEKLKRLLDDYQAAFHEGKVLNINDFMDKLAKAQPGSEEEKRLTRILMGDADPSVKKPEEPTGEKPKTAPAGQTPKDQAAKLAGDVLASVGFDGSQAYGVPGDRHVYQDAAGNKVSLSVTTRRMPDGTFEDVLHVVNINNRTAPHGATFSLRSDFDKLQAGVPVSIGGLSFNLKLTANGDDHSISMEGEKGPFMNLKEKPEPPMSLSELYAYRAARVYSYGRVVEIGGKEYYVSPETYSQLEGAPESAKYVGYGQFTYWPKDRLDKVFAPDAAKGRDEVDPQTVDLKKLDFKGGGFMGPRDIRPELSATVIRREGAQDISYPRVSMGKDSQGRWWDAVLKDGQYTVQPGTEPKPGSPGFPTPPEEERRLGRFGQGTPSDWSAVMNRKNEPLVAAPGFPLPPGGSPGVAAYVGKEGDILYIRSSFKDAAGTIWTSGPQEAFALKPGIPNRPPLPQAQLRPAPFVTDVPIGPILSSIVHVFDGGASGYIVFETRSSLESTEYVPIGIPVVWGDKFTTPQAAFDYHREHPKEGLDYLTAGGTP